MTIPLAPTNLRIVGQPVTGALGQSDLTYLGAFCLNGDGGSSCFQQGLTFRYVGGNLRIYSSTLGSHLLEYSVPALKTSPAYNNAPLTYDFGDLYDGKRVVDAGSGITTYGLHWDETDQRMYWVYQAGYGASIVSACIGYSIMNDTAHTATGVKAVRLPASITSKIAFGLTPIPTAFATANCNGYRLAVGFGGIASSGASASIGPALCAIDPAEIGSIAHQGYLTHAVRMVQHGGLRAYDGLAPFYAKRDTDYLGYYGSQWNPIGGVGYWGENDFLRSGGFWIHTANKDGLLLFVQQSCNGGVTTAPQNSTLVSATVTGCVLTNAILGLTIGDLVSVATSGTQDGQVARIMNISGLNITYDNGAGAALATIPNVPGNLKRGQWYTGGTTWSTRSKHTCYVYDQGGLAAGAHGTTPLSSVPYSGYWDHQFGFASYPLAGYPEPNNSWGGEGPNEIKGVTFDPLTSLLYVLVKAIGANPPYVAVYQVP
jgi:hypothetical protein